ncbi:cardiolipin synthase [Bacteroidia bacterium]|nr:cardiolipin synthase [Bacteroidia bacterium]GHT85096.1 cardiolipin synthase [Bacteroidia bacterium]
MLGIFDFFSSQNVIVYLIYVLLIAGTVIVVISENRSPIKTIAWLLVLIFVPIFGLIVYYIFGQDTRRMRHISERKYEQIRGLSFKNLTYNRNIKILPEYANLINLLRNSNLSPVLQGSKVEIITEGTRMFEALLDDMEKAKHHIHIEFFIFKNDQTGKIVKEMLMKKAAQGVEVRFLYDNVANWAVPNKFYGEMKASGVQITSMLKAHFLKFADRLNYRNHRKVVVIDGVTAYMGGMNISNNYCINPNWRDTHLRIQGQGALGLQACFLIDWYSSGKPFLDDIKYFPEAKDYTQNLMQIATGGAYSIYHSLLQATVNIIIGAKKYIYLQTPYFLPTESLYQALQMAALSGIDVRLMVAHKSDSAYVDPAAHSYYQDLLEAGMKIYELQNKVMHAKTLVADDMISAIGSANLDFRSFETNFEINCYLYDPHIARRNKEIFFQDMENCKEVFYEDWIKRSKWKKFCDSVMRLFAPLM